MELKPGGDLDDWNWREWADHWSLEPGTLYFNHGAFGPSPRPVIEARHQALEELERNPMDFYVRRLDERLDHVTMRLAQSFGCAGGDLVLVPNSTVAMNAVAHSVKLESGDEVLLTDHDYGAVVRAWGRRCGPVGAKTVLACPSDELHSSDQITQAIADRITPKTRIIVVSHVTSPTATVFPVADICRLAKERGILVCIDGPHALMMRPVNLRALGCDYYVASCHKWLSAPFGTGFLYVDRRHQQSTQPVVTSWGRRLSGGPSRWQDEFHWFGTYDPSPYLAIPAALDFLEGQVGLERFRGQTHNLARYGRQRLEQVAGSKALVPDDAEWYGSMITMPLPGVATSADYPNMTHPLQRALWEEARIEIPIIEWRNRVHIRISCHLYHTPADVDRLCDALTNLLPRFR